jgi:hypothetical protein
LFSGTQDATNDNSKIVAAEASNEWSGEELEHRGFRRYTVPPNCSHTPLAGYKIEKKYQIRKARARIDMRHHRPWITYPFG